MIRSIRRVLAEARTYRDEPLHVDFLKVAVAFVLIFDVAAFLAGALR